MQTQKKDYLKLYLLQESKIKRLEQMARIYPDKKQECEFKISEAKLLRKTIEEKINAVDNPLLSELLYQKYVLGKTLEELSLIFNYSLRHIERLHKKALEKIEI